MTGKGASVTIDPRKFAKKVDEISEKSSMQAAQITADRCREEVIAAGRVNTGHLANSFRIKREVSPPAAGIWWRVYSTVKYSDYQNLGTGGSTAKPGHVLRFKPKGLNLFVFARHTAPIRGAHFMEKALKRLTLKDFLPKS